MQKRILNDELSQITECVTDIRHPKMREGGWVANFVPPAVTCKRRLLDFELTFKPLLTNRKVRETRISKRRHSKCKLLHNHRIPKEYEYSNTNQSARISTITCATTVKLVFSGPVLNGHPLLSGQLQKSRKFLLLTTLNVTSIKRSPLLSGRGHLLQSPSEGISIVFTCIKRSLH